MQFLYYTSNFLNFYLLVYIYIYIYLIAWDIRQYGKLLHECVQCALKFNWLKLTGQYNWAIWENIAQRGIGNFTLLGNMAR